MQTGASINGRLLAGSAVTLNQATVIQVAQTKKACEGIMNAEKTVFDAGQKADLLAFTVAQAAAKRVFEAAQESAKLAFTADQKADKLAFTLQQTIDKAQCNTLL